MRDAKLTDPGRGLAWSGLLMSALLTAGGCSQGEKPVEESVKVDPKNVIGEEKVAAVESGGDDPAVGVDRLVEVFAQLYKDNMKTLGGRVETEFEYAEDVVLAMGQLDPASPTGAKELEERMSEVGMSGERMKKLLSEAGMGGRLTNAVVLIKKADLGPVFQKLADKKLPTMSQSKEGCQKLPAAIEKAQAACVTPSALARFHMGVMECKSRKEAVEEVPPLPNPEEYRAACLEKGALWPLIMKSAPPVPM